MHIRRLKSHSGRSSLRLGNVKKVSLREQEQSQCSRSEKVSVSSCILSATKSAMLPTQKPFRRRFTSERVLRRMFNCCKPPRDRGLSECVISNDMPRNRKLVTAKAGDSTFCDHTTEARKMDRNATTSIESSSDLFALSVDSWHPQLVRDLRQPLAR